MIVCDIKDSKRYDGVTPLLGKALQWLRTTDFSKLTPGKVEIQGDKIYCSVQEYATRDYEKTGWEAHRKYIDIQVLAKGSECIEVAPLSLLKETAPYADDKDFLALDGQAVQTVTLVPGQIAVLFPEDAHRPGIHGDRKTSKEVHKLVVKVAVN